MAIPAFIRTEVAALASAVTAAAPLKTASRLLLVALQRQGVQAIADIDAALGVPASTFDPTNIISTTVPGDESSDFATDTSSDFATDTFYVGGGTIYQKVAEGYLIDAQSDPSGYPGTFPAILAELAMISEDQAVLCDMRGLVGRAMFNLSQGAV